MLIATARRLLEDGDVDLARLRAVELAQEERLIRPEHKLPVVQRHEQGQVTIEWAGMKITGFPETVPSI